ncbi:hypothetical protein CC85DRAFT_101637 [Cutaneotrichosporon oleaginosum]|uniref:Uncharacterized protein n=1 Tax=Cutaneotrichosporon oleaginosum TaxID=879819 RepID=A0A0J0XLD8_9TREE|nr:uncharacterized protein CC85DRAFT_101637 [Cutaneotrichosporon oleaginosum]KLT41897.1 hypothetical protein CC85DRAFT_101637 [Cutaneotrichosporon oleaginosum]TXT12497.1 hypothetical protein COLE_02907 [Cutaneotrichosporon oleaginosum]
MPSLLTPAGAGRSISRVNSFTRDWGDDDKAPSSTPIEWSPSPPRVKTKLPFSAPARSAPPMSSSASVSNSTLSVSDGLTPQERRRRAILEAMPINPPSARTSATSSLVVAAPPRPSVIPPKASSSTLLSSSRLNVASSGSSTKLSAAADTQALPELPTLDIKKRPKPWEGDFS